MPSSRPESVLRVLLSLAMPAGAVLVLSPHLARADDEEEIVWSDWIYGNRAQANPVGHHLSYVGANDFWGAKFTIEADILEVSFKLWAGQNFQPDGTHVVAMVRELDPPYDMLWNTSIDISDLTGSGPGGEWRSVVMDFGDEPLNGTYWIGFEALSDVQDGELLNYAEDESALTWDPFYGRFIERDGLIYRNDGAYWLTNAVDALIRVRRKDGYNALPIATIKSVNPNPSVIGQTVTLTGSGSDTGTIVLYEWSTPGELLYQGTLTTYNWVPDSPGSYTIRLRVRDDDVTWSEYASETADVEEADPPGVGGLRDSYSGGLGHFLSTTPGLGSGCSEIYNTYSVRVNQGDFPATHVIFRMTKDDGGITPRESDSSDQRNGRFYAEFRMDDLPVGDYTIGATAYDSEGNPSVAVYGDFEMQDPRPWWGGDWVGDDICDWYAGPRTYTFSGFVPYDPEYGHSLIFDTDDFGTFENYAGLHVDVVERFDVASGTWSHEATGGVSVIIMSNPSVFDGNATGGRFDFNVPFEWLEDPNRYEWELLNWTESSTIAVDDMTVWSYDSALVDFDINLSLDGSMNASFAVDGTLTETLRADELACIRPSVEADTDGTATLDVNSGVATATLNAAADFVAEMDLCYTNDDGPVWVEECWAYEFSADGSIHAGWGPAAIDIAMQVLVADAEPDGCNDGFRGGGVPVPDSAAETLLQSPRIASDGQGRAMAVWIHDNNGGVGTADPDVFYSCYDGASWTAPAAVATTNLFETDPRVVYTGPNQALLVVTQNQMIQAVAEAAVPAGEFNELEVVLAEQELVYHRFLDDGSCSASWTPSAFVSADSVGGVLGGARADGRAELAAGPGGTAMVVWVRDVDGHMFNPAMGNLDTEIRASRWTGALWTVPQIFSPPPGGAYVQPDVAFDLTPADAVVVWVYDQDADFNTLSDRSVEYVFYDSAMGWNMPGAPAVSGVPGVLWPTVYFDMYDHPVVVFTRRGPNETGQHPSGSDYGEGIHDYLWSASSYWDSPTTPPFTFDLIGSVGGPYQNRARWPRASVYNPSSLPPDFQPMAFVGCRSFTGDGPNGFDGELGVTMRKLEDWLPFGYLPSPVVYDSDGELDWQVDLDVDNALHRIRTVRVKPSANDPTPVFGSGYDSIVLKEFDLGFDLRIAPADITLSQAYPQSGQTITIEAGVRNSGTQDVPSTVTVEFYLDEIVPANLIGSDSIVGPFECLTVKFAATTWVADGMAHDLWVVVDPADVVPEVNEDNNESTIAIRVLDPPEELELIKQDSPLALVLYWHPPSDPSHPPVNHYHVYRDVGQGFELLTQTSETTFVDDGPASADYQVTLVLEDDSESAPTEPVSGALEAVLDNGVLHAEFTDYGTSGDRLPHGSAMPAQIAWLTISEESQAWSWEGNLFYDDGTGESSHYLADDVEFTVTQPLQRRDGILTSISQNDEFQIEAAHSLYGSTLTTEISVTSMGSVTLSDVNFAWMVDADLRLGEDDLREPCCIDIPWLGYGLGWWDSEEGQGVQTNLNNCADVVPADMSAAFKARLDSQTGPDEWTVGNPSAFMGGSCGFDGDDSAERMYTFDTPFDSPINCVGTDQDLAMVSNFFVSLWEPQEKRTFTYTLTFQQPGDLDGDDDGLPDRCEVECEGDANGDGAVDPLDSGYVMARFGCPVGTGDPSCDAADQNGDGAVDPLDSGFVLARFGECP